MALLSLEHSKPAYRANFVFYGTAVPLLAVFLVAATPPGQRLPVALCAAIGLAGWSLIEYALHRHVLHRLQPFRRWHALHHARPMALVCAPTLLSASLIGGLVFLPMWAAGNLWLGCALTLGVLAGYLAYTVAHHATHHCRARGAWLTRRKRWHALHHGSAQPCCFGVTSGLWDRAFGTGPAPTLRHLALDEGRGG
jgi:cyclopropane-fatty-acyl-phospholipid synthase